MHAHTRTRARVGTAHYNIEETQTMPHSHCNKYHVICQSHFGKFLKFVQYAQRYTMQPLHIVL